MDPSKQKSYSHEALHQDSNSHITRPPWSYCRPTCCLCSRCDCRKFPPFSSILRATFTLSFRAPLPMSCQDLLQESRSTSTITNMSLPFSCKETLILSHLRGTHGPVTVPALTGKNGAVDHESDQVVRPQRAPKRFLWFVRWFVATHAGHKRTQRSKMKYIESHTDSLFPKGPLRHRTCLVAPTTQLTENARTGQVWVHPPIRYIQEIK